MIPMRTEKEIKLELKKKIEKIFIEWEKSSFYKGDYHCLRFYKSDWESFWEKELGGKNG
jgi:hypothetical protein